MYVVLSALEIHELSRRGSYHCSNALELLGLTLYHQELPILGVCFEVVAQFLEDAERNVEKFQA